jgi:hypothetical protein
MTTSTAGFETPASPPIAPAQHDGQGHGGEFLAGAVEMTLAAIRLGGGRVIVVDAIDDRAAAFYEHFGFRAMPATPHLFVMKASTAAASLSLDWP